jgi:hypothetical protein
MRFILTADGFKEPQALIPFVVDKVADKAAESVTDVILTKLGEFGAWLANDGLLIFAEFALLYSIFCFCVAITGKGPWMERGFKSFCAFVFLGVAAHAV